MTKRNLSVAQQLANSEASVKFFEMLYIRTQDIPAGVVDPETYTPVYQHNYLTNAPFNIAVTTEQAAEMGLPVAGAQTFLAVGPFLQFSSVDESADFQINTVTVTLGGVRSADIALFTNNLYIDQPIKIFRAWFDGDGLMIDTPLMIFDGRVDRPVVSDDPQSAVTIGCSAASQWVDYERRAGRHTNHAEQDFYFPGDTGFKYAGNPIKDLKWGG
jgi:hypothetical protein